MNLSEDVPTLWEAGHYYTDKGPTDWSKIGWQIMETFKKAKDASMLFIDDIHSTEVLHPEEQNAPLVPFEPTPDHTALESEMAQIALDILQELKGLTSKKKAKQRKNGKWYLAGFPVTHPDGHPMCCLLDAALTLHKSQLGFNQGVNVLPGHYNGQQWQVHKILSRVLPEFKLNTLFFNKEGALWTPDQTPVIATATAFKHSEL